MLQEKKTIGQAAMLSMPAITTMMSKLTNNNVIGKQDPFANHVTQDDDDDVDGKDGDNA